MDVTEAIGLKDHRFGCGLCPGATTVQNQEHHRWIVAVSGSPNSQECIRLLNAGADYYIDAWLPAEELVARVRVVLRFAAWLGESKDVLTNSSRI